MLDVNPDNEITYNNTIKMSSVAKWATFIDWKIEAINFNRLIVYVLDFFNKGFYIVDFKKYQSNIIP